MGGLTCIGAVFVIPLCLDTGVVQRHLQYCTGHAFFLNGVQIPGTLDSLENSEIRKIRYNALNNFAHIARI